MAFKCEVVKTCMFDKGDLVISKTGDGCIVIVTKRCGDNTSNLDIVQNVFEGVVISSHDDSIQYTGRYYKYWDIDDFELLNNSLILTQDISSMAIARCGDLVISRYNKTIVLATRLCKSRDVEDFTGVVVSKESSCDYDVGEHRDDWYKQAFNMYDGKATIQKENARC